MKFRFLHGSAALAALLVVPGVARAQSTTAADATPNQGVGDIVVTAQRRSEPAQNVGVALTVLSGDALEKIGVTTVNQLQDHVPSLEIVPAFGSGQPQFRLRGVGFDDYAANNSPTVGIYIDDVAYPVPVATQGALYDIDRVEVLRGPQGTLYGRNTTGGAINFISRKPTDQLTAGVDLEYGSYYAFKGEAFVSGPISDTLKFRVAGITEQGGSFQYNRATGQTLGDANRVSGKGTLEWQPSATATITFNVHAGYDKSELTGLYLFEDFQTRGYGVGTPGPIIPADTNTRLTGWGFNSNFTSLFGWDANSKPRRDNIGDGGSINAVFDLSSAVRLTSITAYDYYRRAELESWDASAAEESEEFWHSNIGVLSQELRLSSQTKGPLEWVGGVYYAHQGQDDGFYSDFTNSLGFITNTSYRQYVDTISGFGQANYAVTSQISLVGGLRYEHEDRRLRGFSTAIGTYQTFTNGNRDTSFDQVTGKASIEYRPVTGLLTYAEFSRGVKSGGFTAYNSPYADQIDSFAPEVLYAYEVGFKGDVNKAVRLNAAAFYYDYHDQQVLGTVLSQQSGLIGRITNAPRSEIYGGETELVLAPIKALRITQSVSYKYGRYLQYDAVDPTSLTGTAGNYTASTISYAHTALPIARWGYQGTAAWTQELGAYAVEASGDYSYRGRLPSFLGTTYDLASRWLVDANLTLRPAEGKWSVGLYGRNIFNTHYDLERNYFLPNAKVAQPGRPSSFGVQLNWRY